MANPKKISADLVAGTANWQAQNADCEVTPLSLRDRLIQKRTNLTRETNAKVRELDRQINSLEISDAEEVIKNAERALYEN